MRAEQVTDVVTEHGEGPVWWPGWGGLRLVDTFAGDVVHVAQDGTVSRWHVADVVTSLRPRAAGGVVLATRDGFATADAPGGPVRVVADGVVPAPQRMNDGGCDPYGSFWCGSYDPTGRGAGALFRLGPDDELSRELDGVHVSNGIVWTTDGRTAYYADSGPRRVDRFHFDGRRLVAREPFVTIEDGAATTDGLCLDAEGGSGSRCGRGTKFAATTPPAGWTPSSSCRSPR